MSEQDSKKNHNLEKSDWDVIVIGTGLGGSAAGGISALHGLKTLILDKNPRPGGSCSYYEKEGFKLDIGTHLFIRGNKGPFGDCTQRLGLGHCINFLTVDPMAHYKGMNVDLAVPLTRLSQINFMYQFARQVKIPITEYFPLLRLLKDIFFMGQKGIEEIEGVSLNDFFRRYTDNNYVLTIIGFLLGLYFVLPTKEASAGEAVWNIQKMFKEANLGYPKGGAVSIPKAFLRGAEKHGAKVQLNAGVKKIDISNNKATGVVLSDGSRLTSRAIISTTSLKDTILTLAGPEYFSATYVDRIKNIKSSMIAVQAKIALKKKLVKAGSLVGGPPLSVFGKMENNLIDETYNGLLEGKIAGMVPIYCPVPSNYDPDLAPEGCQILTSCAVAPTLDIPLTDEPQKWIDSMMDAMNKMIPGLEENTIFCDTFSVKSIANWIGKTGAGGGAISTGQTTHQVGNNRHGHQTPIRGLYIAGDCGGPARGVGTELACQSGMDCGDLVARDIVNCLLE